ncbi:MarR family transcriptional regulator [Chelatococcus sp. SYSU_G07232]|uniref:MarR family transcriptional regulator n=1 Tax=Chelatococcus albus TaxID=3047466 RepID=A0ABT7ALY4_9HYPH|nr:MarR family transcriptional regulator [Chelatococcus sp. SYSU_G07232]MDJ1159596.1 MarR family transcriptional regulator [Chelatococcus sp. SYSU_G07232]
MRGPLAGKRKDEGPAVAAVWENDLVARGMARWRRARPDIDCSGKAIVGRVLQMHDVILKAVNRTLARHGLKYPAYAVLATLRVEGAPYRMSPSALGQTLLLTSGGLSNLLRRMEKAGHVRRMADARDGRGVIVELTERGLSLADAAMADHAAVERQLVAVLPPELRDDVARALSLMITAHA